MFIDYVVCIILVNVKGLDSAVKLFIFMLNPIVNMRYFDVNVSNCGYLMIDT